MDILGVSVLDYHEDVAMNILAHTSRHMCASLLDTRGGVRVVSQILTHARVQLWEVAWFSEAEMPGHVPAP